MKILNVSRNDWANFAYANLKALQAAGADATGFKEMPHGFNYSGELQILSEIDIASKIKEADIVQIFHSYEDYLPFCKGKKVIVYHTGTGYRQAPERANSIFNPNVEFCFSDQTEFMNLGAKGVRYITTAIDTENIYPQKYVGDKIRIGHFPSKIKGDLKGTSKIIDMLLECKDKFDKENRFEIVIDTKQRPHPDYLKKLQSVDIYVELFAPSQEGKEYGCYGVTAFEAAAMGKVVVTQNLHPEVYEKEFGATELLYANSRELFFQIMENLMESNSVQLQEKADKTRLWAVDKHSYKAMGKHLINILK